MVQTGQDWLKKITNTVSKQISHVVASTPASTINKNDLASVKSEVALPFRANTLTLDELATKGRRRAEFHRLHSVEPSSRNFTVKAFKKAYSNGSLFRSHRRLLQRRFRDNVHFLRHAHTILSGAVQKKELLEPGADWLLDNFHLVARNINETLTLFTRSFDLSLPFLHVPQEEALHQRDQLTGVPRIYDVVVEVMRHSDGVLDPERLAAYLRGYQELVYLKVGELWAAPIMARFALIENLRRLAEHLLRFRILRLEGVATVDDSLAELRNSQGPQSDLLPLLAERLQKQPALDAEGIIHIFHRLRERAGRDPIVVQWLERRLEERGSNQETLEHRFRQQQAHDQVSIGNTITSLRSLGMVDWKAWFEEVSLVHQELLLDPAGIYPISDFPTRNICTQQIEKIARRKHKSEIDIARGIIHLCREARNDQPLPATSPEVPSDWHVAYYLIQDREKSAPIQANARTRSIAYLLALLTTTVLLVLGGVNLSDVSSSLPTMLLMILVLIVPASELSVRLLQWVLSHLIRPRPMPKLELQAGIPSYCRTLVTVHGIFTNIDQLTAAVRDLEIRYLANTDAQLFFSILADVSDADVQVSPSDEQLISHGNELIEDLNRRIGCSTEPRFLILFRERTWNISEQRYMGWERKRGKVEEINKLILGTGEPTTFIVTEEEKAFLKTIRFVITLDGDTQLPNQSARKLVGTLAHPLNRPHYDPKLGYVTSGYGIIQPRVSVSLGSTVRSRFAATFAHDAGVDPYTEMVSDFYFDIFGEAVYLGKAIYDVAAFHQAVRCRSPQSSLLSHDLFEGLFARTGLASDIEIFDDFPSKYLSFSKRAHRWTRGDWQLLPWLGTKVPHVDVCLRLNTDSKSQAEVVATKTTSQATPLTIMSWWKIADNLRRSLLAPSLFAMLLASWTVLPGSPFFWLVVATLILAFPLYADLAHVVLLPPFRISLTIYVRSLVLNLKARLINGLFSLAFLPHQAYMMLDAIFVTLYRVFISRRNLLEWQTFSYIEGTAKDDSLSHFRAMMPPLMLGFALCCISLIVAPDRWEGIILMMVIWAYAPYAGSYLSRQRPKPLSELPAQDIVYLHSILRRTWRFFATYLTPKYNYLIPDNAQLDPKLTIAERTSPTNIGLSMVGTLAAYRAGFASAVETLQLLTEMCSTIKSLEHFRGHLFNWYDITTKQPLYPKYVSSVDSGNLCAAYIVAYNNAPTLPDAPLLHQEFIRSTLEVSRARPSLRPIADIFDHDASPSLTQLAAAISIARNIYEEAVSQSDLESLEVITPLLSLSSIAEWYSGFHQLPEVTAPEQYGDEHAKRVTSILESARAHSISITKLKQLVVNVQAFLAGLKTTNSKIVETLKNAATNLQESENNAAYITDTTKSLFTETNFTFLYNQEQRLFRIGFHFESSIADKSTYDLLASEARILSIVAIAKGDVPYKHWFALGRTLTDTQSGKCLASWSGTMFEYLMPILFMRTYPGTLIHESCRVAVRAQERYGAQRGVPWGISESAYSRVDQHGTYQYKAFGVPTLALKRYTENDLVVAPYASLMAIMVDPTKAVKNLRILEELGFSGEHGFFEAIDYTRERLPAENAFHVVKAYFSHHQGMGFLALANFLFDDTVREWFHSDPGIISIQEILDEKFPTRVPLQGITVESEPPPPLDDSSGYQEWGATVLTPHTPIPQTHILSNGNYTVMIDNSGSGFSSQGRHLSLTRWRSDPTSNNYGTYIYLKDPATGAVWSNTYRPTRVEPDTYEVVYNADKVEFKRRDGKLYTTTVVAVAQEDDTEIRQVTISNTGSKLQTVQLTSFAEVALAPFRADAAHPAFSKMFIETEFIPELDALICARRPRSAKESPLFLVHSLSMSTVWGRTECETSRELFVGRGNTLASPQAMTRDNLSGTVGLVLDPIVSLRTNVEVRPGSSQSATFITGVTTSRQDAVRLATRFHDVNYVQRAFNLAWSQSSVELRYEDFSFKDTLVFQRVANALFFPFSRTEAQNAALLKNTGIQSTLWRLGISGDVPIVSCSVSDHGHLSLVQQLLHCHGFLRTRGVFFDLVILNDHLDGYLQPMAEALDHLIHQGGHGSSVDKQGGIFVRNRNHLSDQEVILVKALARLSFDGADGSFEAQIRGHLEAAKVAAPSALPVKAAPSSNFTVGQYIEPPSFLLGTRYGGFIDDGAKFTVLVQGHKLPPLPWSNVISNPNFGTLVSETGGGYTWSENARENRLTPFSNDPVIDPPGEVVFLRDEATGEYWGATPRPLTHHGSYHVTHSFGSSKFVTQYGKIESTLTVSVATDAPIKWSELRLENHSSKPVKLSLFYYVEPVLGVQREDASWMVLSEFDKINDILLATNSYHDEFAGRVLLVGSRQPIVSYTGSKKEFVGSRGLLSTPWFLEEIRRSPPLGLGSPQNPGLAAKVGSSMDHALVLHVTAELPPSGESTVLFFLGEAQTRSEVAQLAEISKSEKFYKEERTATDAKWRSLLGAIKVKTPSPSFDIAMNGWLLYQTISARLWARTGFYQSGGAFGFRDQLQDVLALLATTPHIARDQILLHASRQFVEGDVQHWWHPPTGRGVRTKISDDFIWLAFVTSRYLEATNDRSVLDEIVSYIEGPPLNEHAEAYIVPTHSSIAENLYDHCLRALRRGLAHRGERGLPLMGCGDWNDGMNEVGPQGRGESVWLAWFLAGTLRDFAPVARLRGDEDIALELETGAAELVHAIDAHGWDGEWYRRAYFDDGTPLGTASAQECKIDSISQSWAVITGLGDPARALQGFHSACRHLIDRDTGIIKLLTPPFNSSNPSPGYIQGYLPGVRENGGQYTHAAVWMIIAAAMVGQKDLAFELFSLINPVTRAADNIAIERYRGEPYATSGDVYGVAPHEGRSGWSWYTGSAGWMYQAGLHNILGIHITGAGLLIAPCIPTDWPGYSVTIDRDNVNYIIEVRQECDQEKADTVQPQWYHTTIDGVDFQKQPSEKPPMLEWRENPPESPKVTVNILVRVSSGEV